MTVKVGVNTCIDASEAREAGWSAKDATEMAKWHARAAKTARTAESATGEARHASIETHFRSVAEALA